MKVKVLQDRAGTFQPQRSASSGRPRLSAMLKTAQKRLIGTERVSITYQSGSHSYSAIRRRRALPTSLGIGNSP
jgi:hypothetical protein